jgi:hypothetical protein
MTRKLFAVTAILSVTALHALADPVPKAGITVEDMTFLMSKHGLPTQIDKDSKGREIIKSRVGGINFDVYFYNCETGRCRDVQFAAGWQMKAVSSDRINAWNTEKRFLRVYWKPGNVMFAEHDLRVAQTTTENIDEALELWPLLLEELKQFMKL